MGKQMEAQTLIVLPNIMNCECIIRIFLDFESRSTKKLIMPMYHTLFLPNFKMFIFNNLNYNDNITLVQSKNAEQCYDIERFFWGVMFLIVIHSRQMNSSCLLALCLWIWESLHLWL